MKKCVVTGLGSICAIGNNVEEVWNNAVNGICKIEEIESIDTSKCYTKIAAEVTKFKPTFPNAGKLSKRMDKVSLLCIEAVNEAVLNAGLQMNELSKERLSVVIGSCLGGISSGEKIQRQLLSGNEKISPKEILKAPMNAIAGNVSFFLGAKGVVANIGNACAAGTMSIAYACDLIESGLADVVVAGGADTFSSLAFSGFHALKALDTIPCSPLSRSKGIALGEGAGAVVVESMEHAIKRNAPILCEVLGYGITSDAYHITAPSPQGEGQISAIKLAIKEAGVNVSEIDYINAHGTGTPLNDKSESISLGDIFKNETAKLKISSSKSMMGHCLGAAGTLEAVLSIRALQDNIVPPTMNFVDEDKKGEFDFVPNKAVTADLNIAMSNSFAFGGNNASIIFSKDTGKNKNGKRENKRVFITGIGAVTSVGENKETYWNNISDGASGIVDMDYDKKNYKSKYAAPSKVIDFASCGLNMSELRKMDRLTKLLLVSGTSALKDAGVEVIPEIEKDIGIIVGTSDGPVSDTVFFQEGFIKKGYHAASALIFPNTVYNAAGGYLSIATKSKGHTATLVNGIQSGINSICYGYDLVKTRRQKYIVASGVDEYSENSHFLYDTLTALYSGKKKQNNPYLFEEKGFILGEGSTSLILESEEEAEKRGAFCYAEIAGYGLSNTPMGPGKIDTEGEGLDRAVNIALEQSGLKVWEIDAIVGFANGSAEIDMMEINSYGRIFGNRLSSIPVHSIKALTGEGRAATSALQVAHAAMILSRGESPVTRRSYEAKIKVNGKEAMLTEEPQKPNKNILVTGFSFGGAYSAVILKGIE